MKVLVFALFASLASCYPPRVPRIIQGGMGIRISSWQLAREVSRKGELGVVSGTVLDTVFVRELQMGDPTGGLRRALRYFPDQDMVARMMNKYYIEGGKDPQKSFKSLPMWSLKPTQHLLEATVLANFCEVWLARHNDDDTPVATGFVGINRLTKVQLPTMASLYGAMLADVDYVFMGAGIPLKVPGLLDNLAAGKRATFPIDITGSPDQKEILMEFSPEAFWTAAGKPELAEELLHLKRPNFVPIVSSVVLAQSLLKRANGRGPTKGIQGFVVELPAAGGHNAPPRGFRYDPVAKSHAVDLNERGEPVYGPKDDVDLVKFAKVVRDKQVPFWMAGAYAHADKFCDCIAMGAQGVQVGTHFALAKESGMEDGTRREILETIAQQGNDLDVFTDPVASPTGYPFKVLKIPRTLAEEEDYQQRPRLCSLGYLRTAYMDDIGKVGYRCPAEPVADWVKNGGEVEATVGRKCLCNALCANIGMPQTRKYKDENGETRVYVEGKLITIGDEVNLARKFAKQDENTGEWSFSAAAVVDYLKSEWDESGARTELTDILRREFSSTTTAESPATTAVQ